MTKWMSTTPGELMAALRPGGNLYGQSERFPKLLRLHKTSFIDSVSRLDPEHACVWKIDGDPNETGQYARNRRSVVVWLGK